MNASSPSAVAEHVKRDSRRQRIRAAQVRLLYCNANVGVGVNLVATALLGRLQWGVVPHLVILIWCLYMVLVLAGRYTLGRLYRSRAPSNLEASRWGAMFSVGAGLVGVGWGAAAFWLFPAAQLSHQIYLVFILGGMILGSAFVLASWGPAYHAFMIPTGLAPAARLVFQGDEAHVAMGLLAALFTLATLITTRRMHLTIVSSLGLQFENRDLVEDLQAAKTRAEVLNEQLEVRVKERTAELQRSAEQLRTEITRREQMEEDLLRARKLESLGVLAGGIAHDLNNFLTVVQGNIEMARMRLGADESIQAMLDQTVSACRRAGFLSSQLLTFAKGGAPVRRLVSVAELVLDAVQLARAGSHSSILVNVPEDLRCAEVDTGQIGQALHNILLNARQAMPDGGIIEVHAENVVLADVPGAGARVRISVRDHGRGIPADVLPRIFDPYFTTKPGGSGLGLATAYAIIAKHGGTLSVESNPGHGAVFTIDLPASQESLAPQAPLAAQVETGTERLLVMDDEEDLRMLLGNVLTRLGYQVQTARDGAEAIARMERAKASGVGFDAVLLDLTVSGGMGGIEAAARLRQMDPSLKLIVSSGYSDAAVMSDFRKYGFDAVLPKPWAIGQVGEVVRGVLGPRRSTGL